jgi:hypothetical protein
MTNILSKESKENNINDAKPVDAKPVDAKPVDAKKDNEIKSTTSKRGRKKKTQDATEKEKPPPKKRGRKPRGGKFIEPKDSKLNLAPQKQNIILHLKCNQKDLVKDTTDMSIETYNFKNKSSELLGNNTEFKKIVPKQKITTSSEKDGDTNSITVKLLELAIQLQTNNIIDDKSACFWCTYNFDNPSIYIPKYKLDQSYQCYGCFCSPECATAYLFKESIDSSTKFERYHLLNFLYSKIYDYNKNIKPAPCPYYTLTKYYGNLSIQEYRGLLKNERLLIVIDKPLTRVLPELHDDSSSFLNTGIMSHTAYKVRKKSTPVSKTAIVKDTFSGK